VFGLSAGGRWDDGASQPRTGVVAFLLGGRSFTPVLPPDPSTLGAVVRATAFWPACSLGHGRAPGRDGRDRAACSPAASDREVLPRHRSRARAAWSPCGVRGGADNDGVTTETANAPTPPPNETDETSAPTAAPAPDAPAVDVRPLRLVVVSGMSGAGRSTAADNLEDLGWYVVDNLPPSVLPDVCDEARRTGIRQLAVVLDVRTRSFFEQLPEMFAELKGAGTVPEIVYLEASDEVIVRRQESVRRPHPLQGDGRLLDGINRERDLLATLRAAADLVIDTSSLNVHQLGSRISHAYGGPDHALRVTVLSFGFKNGIPLDADMIFDVRFLPNPHWVPELRPQTGLSAPVSAYVLGQAGAEPFLGSLQEVLATVASGYLQEGKRFATIGIGCTGGKHRSTAIAEELARRLRVDGLPTTVLHRDLGRE